MFKWLKRKMFSVRDAQEIYKKALQERSDRKYNALIEVIITEISINLLTDITIKDDINEDIINRLERSGFIVEKIEKDLYKISGWENDNYS
jgi:hypothetical protein